MSEKTVVTTNEGKIRGIKEKSAFSGIEYYAFYGVPYAQSTANHRFKDPVKVKPWKDVYDATTERNGCIQFSMRLGTLVGSEDCLYNNIYTTQLPNKGDPLKPIIVNIHPGAMFFGSPDPSHYGSPNFIMQNDIIYICVGYRLHILGFLNLNIEECSGNQGLKDIILALEWIRDNASVFGGDPNNVTLLGSSSGAILIHCLMITPLARGLFHKVVMMGSYLFNTVYSVREENESIALQIAKKLGYVGDNKKKLLAFLKKLPAELLIQQHRLCEVQLYQNTAALFPCGVFLPLVDQGEKALFPHPVRDMIANTARVPLLIGICDNEAVMGFSEKSSLRKGTDTHFKTAYRQNAYGWMHRISDEQLKIINDRIESFYLNGTPIEKAPLSIKVNIQTDAGFSDLYPTLIDLISKDLPDSVYVYKFSFEGDIITMKDGLKGLLQESLKGTFHAADFSYWAYMGYDATTDRTREMVKRFTKLISVFAKTGNPNNGNFATRWKPSTPQNPCHLSINDRIEMIDTKLNGERMTFWEELKREFKKDTF